MKLLFLDTETTGEPLWKEPSEDPRQPHIVQLAAALIDTSRPDGVIASINLLVRPDDWEIPAEATAVHGITTEYASAYGIAESEALLAYYALWCRCDQRVIYNKTFDDRIVRIAMKRNVYSDTISDAYKAAPAHCAMQACRPFVKIPNFGKAGFKVPTLGEAHQHFFDAPHEGAHSAWGDMRALMAVHFATAQREREAAKQPA